MEFVNGKDDIPYMKWKISQIIFDGPQSQWLDLSPCRLIHRSYVPSVLWLNHVKIVPLGFRLPRISIIVLPKKMFQP